MSTKTARVSHARIAKFLRTTLETIAARDGADVFTDLKDLADEYGLSLDTTEEILRGMSGVSLVPVGQTELPRRARAGKGAGYYPAVKLETDGERRARELYEGNRTKAADALQGAVAHLGLHVTSDLRLVPIEGNGEDVMAAILLTLAAA